MYVIEDTNICSAVLAAHRRDHLDHVRQGTVRRTPRIHFRLLRTRNQGNRKFQAKEMDISGFRETFTQTSIPARFFLDKEMDSKTVTVTAHLNSLEAFLIHVA
jgi:hypothetical protein